MRRLRLLFGDPIADALIQDIEREGAPVEDFVVEGSDVEFVAELIFGVLAKSKNLQLSEFVSEGLSGPGDVPIHFTLNIGLVHRGVAVEVLHHLIAGPALLVYAGIND